MSVSTLVPVDVYRDPDLGTWHFSIDSPTILGGGQPTKEDAMEAAAQALAAALVPTKEPMPDPNEPDGEIQLLEVVIRPTE
jgi:hypothetical protein